MTNTYLNSLGALHSATGPMASTVNFANSSESAIARLELIVWPSGFAFTSTAHAGNTVTHLDFKYTVSGDDAPPAFAVSPAKPQLKF